LVFFHPGKPQHHGNGLPWVGRNAWSSLRLMSDPTGVRL
jgi:hypothetical protein